MSKLAPAAFVALSLFAAATATAESKSWAAVKGSVMPKAAIVFGGNLDAVRTTKLYTSAVQALLASEADAQEAFTLIKDTCQIDVPTAVADFTVVMQRDEKPLIVLGLNGLDEARVVGCLEAVAQKKTGQAVKLTGKRKGKITSYSIPGEKKQIHAAWLAKDVIAFIDDPSNRGRLQSMTTGKAAKGQLGKLLAKANTSAPLWGAVAIKEKEDGMTMMGGYGDVALAGGKFTASIHVELASADEAQKALAMGQMGLDEVKKSMPAKTPMAALLGTLKLGTTGPMVDITASMADGDAMQIAKDLDSAF